MDINANKVANFLTASRERLIKVTFSSAKDGSEYQKIVLRPVKLRSGECWQAERFKGAQVFHLNLSPAELEPWLSTTLFSYAQTSVLLPGETVTYVLGKSGALRERRSANLQHEAKGRSGNDRKKEYIINEGDNVPALVELGVFTKELKIVKSKYDKFKQINRFVELVDDAYSTFSGKEITVLDFGCGKSYLTFILYHYFTKVKGVRAKIIGYDLKADVVAHCNEIAEKYGYSDLKFVVADVTRDMLYDQKIDMVISLHACDVATDYALNYAIKKGVKNIFSVPCCQHEINLSIHDGGDLDPLLRYGLIRERTSALLTDAIRAMLLEDAGYSVDVLEFIDFSHSPKNVMLRAKKTKPTSNKNRKEIDALISHYGFKQTLFELTRE